LSNTRRLKNYKPSQFKAPGSVYKERFADSAVYFVNQLKHGTGKWRGVPFELIDWQERIIRDLFGIVNKKDECRQFRRAYIEVPKKNGKSELGAAIALLLLCTDAEHGGEIYGCATDRAQASRIFDAAMHMVEQFPMLKKYIKLSISQKRMTFTPLNSFYQVCSAEAYTKDGLNAHGIIFDELHAQPNRDLFDVMTAGSGLAREQPLLFMITTAGYDRNSICWEQHQKAEDILRGKAYDPTFYPVIYSAADDDDWTDPEVWQRVNPSYGITIDPRGFEMEFADAQQNVTQENRFRRLNLNQWVRQEARWMPMELWDLCNFHIDLDELAGRECYAGLDLSSTRDMTAFVLCFPPLDEDDKYIFLPFFWLPEDSLEKRVRSDHAPYDQFIAEGLLEVTEGAVINYKFVEKKIEELAEVYEIKEIAFDRWGAHLLRQNLEDSGFNMIKFGQGFQSLSPPSKELMRLVLEQRIAHGGNRVLRWNMDNIVMPEDAAGNIKPDKKKATERIDGAVAAIMALDRAILNENHDSVYNERGMLVLDPNHPDGYYYGQ
jgi:phage terminase large subunit-like protein